MLSWAILLHRKQYQSSPALLGRSTGLLDLCSAGIPEPALRACV